MLATESGQVGMFDAAQLVRPLPEGSFFALLAEHGDRIVRDEDFAECYSRRMGRPSIRPSLLAKVMLLQHRTGLSDEAAMEAVAWDLRWKVALGLEVDHQGWHPTSLTKFRARLLLHGKEHLALENTLRLAEEIGLLDGTAEQIIDSTPMLGAAATQDTVRLVRHGVKKLIDAVARIDCAAGVMLDDGLEFDYAKPAEKPDCRWREKAARERMLTRVAQDAERALQAVEQAGGLLDDSDVAGAHRLLRELIGQDFDVDDDGLLRLHRGTASGRVISTVDVEMRHGRKSQHQRFDGYKLSATATNTDTPLITAVDVAPASEQDGPQAKQLVDAQPRSRRPDRLLGDTAYGTGPVRAELAQRDVEVLAPVPEGHGKEGRLAKRDFHIDLAAGTVTCPAGHTTAIRTEPSGQRRAAFAKARCSLCPLRGRCVAPARGTRQVLIAPDEKFLIAARQALVDPHTAEHLRRTRPRIERLLGLLAVRYGARKSRYFGRAKARLQAAWAAALVNLNPIARHLAAQTA
ncbi:MAG: IS1182 family transposase [Vicinamibacterales bacterium]